VLHHPDQDEVRPEGRDRQVEALHPNRGKREDEPQKGAHESRADERGEEGKAELGGQERGCIGPDPDEGRVTDRDLPCVPEEDVEPLHGDDVDADDDEDGERAVAEEQRGTTANAAMAQIISTFWAPVRATSISCVYRTL